ncbi:MAG: MBL fold metallo-hydrolase [Oscillospiraceae bacterium]|jgi:L-ascorbate metabolism protein UlaG (beta-lactamase superfamily)
MAVLTYQGHGSFRIQTTAGTVVYVDPYAGDGYDLPADLILVTHGHHDHNEVSLIQNRNPGCTVITHMEALRAGAYQTFAEKDVSVEAVPAYNGHHDRNECVGYLLRFDGITVYASGDTSTTDWMQTAAPLQIDYALYPIDGIYNMDAAEAARCAALVGAKHNIPIHMKPQALFDRAMAETFGAPNRLIVEPGETISLS